MPAMWMSKATSCGPTSRRVIVVFVSGSVAEVAAYAETVVGMVLLVLFVAGANGACANDLSEAN
jgi:hypothetical protein